VLQPNDPENYYLNREIVPRDMLDGVNRAKIVITNYHAFIELTLVHSRALIGTVSSARLLGLSRK
jgi:hypothetical protein